MERETFLEREYPESEVGGILAVVYANAGNRNTRGHLNDGEKRV